MGTIQDNESAADHSRNSAVHEGHRLTTALHQKARDSLNSEHRTGHTKNLPSQQLTHKRHMQHEENIGISVVLQRHLVWL